MSTSAAPPEPPPSPPSGRLARALMVTSGRRAKWVVLVVMLVIAGGLASQAGKFDRAQKNETTSFLPGGAESVKVFELNKRFDHGDVAAAVIVFARQDGRLTAADRAVIARDRAALSRDRSNGVGLPSPPTISPDGQAALMVVDITVRASDSDRFRKAVEEVRNRASGTVDGLQVKVTGPAGYSLDAIKVFGNINGQLLLVAGGLVLLLLIIIYRSPIFWTIPFFTVLMAEGTSRGIGYLLAQAGVTINGQSGGILPVLVFGAGTDYALLLVSRYREELRHAEDKHVALRRALGTAGPAIFASALTVVLALLTLLLAQVNGTSGLGPIGAMGVAIAAVFMLTLLPALLGVFGRRAFWPLIPHVGDSGTDVTHGPWRRIGERIRVHPRRVWVTGAVVLLIMAAGILDVNTGLTSANGFRGKVEAVQGQALLSQHFPAGSSAPVDVIVPDRAKVPAVRAALAAHPELVARVAGAQVGPPGVRIEAVLRRDPYGKAAQEDIPRLRTILKAAAGPQVLVGGQTAAEYDLRTSATRDNLVIIPVALVVVFLVLALLLRALLAPLLLVLSTIVSFAAALGFGIVVFNHVFNYPGEDPSLPLLCFVFLVALGIDYNIFLMARVREETHRFGTREGMLRGLAVTGTVITSAGIVLAGTFGALAVLPLVSLTEVGVVIAFGVLLDTFVVRSILVPALVFDVGARVWWPSRLARERRGDDDGDDGPARDRRSRDDEASRDRDITIEAPPG
jgi:RND superfamily putative drug exporter